MTLDICDKRQAILSEEGQLLVVGGPGSGKTTIALLKARNSCSRLQPGQRILFLSFSRAAVKQIVTRSAEMLSSSERRLVQVRTYHLFCLQLLQSHGALLNGLGASFLVPAAERLRKSQFDGDWHEEAERLAREESIFCFDQLAGGVANLLEQSRAVRALYGSKYPIVILDEFQDTDNDQWRLVKAMATEARVVCLADPRQRIFDFRPKVSPERIEQLRSELSPREFDLGADNHRSPSSEILEFADAILRNQRPLPKSKDVRLASYYGTSDFDGTVHANLVWTYSKLRARGINEPCVAVLCRSNALVVRLSGALLQARKYAGQVFNPVPHDVVWDADLAASSGQVVGSIMEWPSVEQGLVHTLDLVADYFRLKHAEKPTQSAERSSRQFEAAARAVEQGKVPRIKAGKELRLEWEAGIKLGGEPVGDWAAARRVLERIDATNAVGVAAQLIRLHRATDALASELMDLWQRTGTYVGAAALVRRTLDQERLLSAERDPSGCMLMSMHKSKGREFDAVVLVEGTWGSSFLDESREAPPFEASRRLLRVAITRARHFVTLVRRRGARHLVD